MAANPAIWLSANSERFRTIILWLAMRLVSTNCAVAIAWISLKLSSRECGQSTHHMHYFAGNTCASYFTPSLSSLRFHIHRHPHRWDSKNELSNVHTKVIIIVLKLEKPSEMSVSKRWERVLVLSNSIDPWQWSSLCGAWMYACEESVLHQGYEYH